MIGWVTVLNSIRNDYPSKLVEGGMTAHKAMENILATYGRYNIQTKIINMILRDRKNGVIPPRLRV